MRRSIVPLHKVAEIAPVDQKKQEPAVLKPCSNLDACGCNWLLPATSAGALCVSCATTRTIPDLSSSRNQKRWHHIETAKRRLLLTLLDLGLWGPQSIIVPALPLLFDFKESLDGGPPVLTGHQDGIITLNIAEADGDQRESLRAWFLEPYRTVLGHFRHEIGHHFWGLLIKGSPHRDEYRALFGDETADYATAMQSYYATGPAVQWAESHVSAYATMHPWEDWAESWAHCLHMIDTLETANQSGLDSKMPGPKHDPAAFAGIVGATTDNAIDFTLRTERWCGIVILANEISRSMGQPDVYPFALTVPVLRKLFFIERVIQAATRCG